MENLKIKHVNITLHNKTARFFEKNIELFNPYEQRFINKRLLAVNKTCDQRDLCCDLCCGTGFLIRKLFNQFKQLVGLDISREMLRICKANNKGANVYLVLADSENLPFREGIFDLITIHAALHHIPSISNCFKEINRVLTKNGVMYIDHEPNAKHLRRASEKTRGLFAFIEYVYEKKHNVTFSPFSNLLMPSTYAVADVHCQDGFYSRTIINHLKSRGFTNVKISYHNIFSSYFYKLHKPFDLLSFIDIVFDGIFFIKSLSSHICIWAKK